MPYNDSQTGRSFHKSCCQSFEKGDSAMSLMLYQNMPRTACNTVLRISGMSDFVHILPGFLREASAGHHKVCYIHFSDQPMVTDGYEGELEICDLPLTHRFETFTVAVHQAILRQPEDTFFLFDSLSDLQTAWATDLMMGNFFRVITPQIRNKRGYAFFPLVRSMHSQAACEEIMQETEVFLDLYSDFQNLYLRAVKILGCEDQEDCFLPHFLPLQAPSSSADALTSPKSGDHFTLISDGPVMSRFFQTVNVENHRFQHENRDAWERFFDHTQRLYESGKNVDAECRRMSEIMMSKDEHIRRMLHEHFTPVDYFFVREHMVGTGLIGGKACGMLIARKIVENTRPDIYDHFEAHDSFFIGSDVFYSYIVDNHFWDLRVRQRTEEGYFALADEFAEKLRTGRFSEKLEKEFLRVLEYYGNCPVIVRSSSILEDGFGNAFAGKYDSVFCMGTGSLQDRLQEFENAIRIVYASTMSRSALDYRKRRGLADHDEQMSLLVMRVSGSFYGDYYFPCAAGVGYSYSTYRFLENLDPAAGMLRLVMGLGTSAVDRTEGSYPRLVSMDKPQATSYKDIAEHHRYSQRKVEVINTRTSRMERLDPDLLKPLLPMNKRNQLFQHDYDAERRFMDRGIRRDITFVSCPGLVRNQTLMKDMAELMQTIQAAYQQPVDIEFTINLDSRSNYLINLLQCRPLQVFRDTSKQSIPDNLHPEDLLLDCSHSSMGLSQATDVDLLIYVDPFAYYNMLYNEKPQVAASIGRINWKLRSLNKKILLFSPGRLGTSSPELGVPTAFSDISEFTGVFEVAESRVGYNPELSYGSHMFQDLVENQILYAAVFENEKVAFYQPEKLACLPNALLSYDDQGQAFCDIIKVYEVSGLGCRLYHDMLSEHLVCTLPKGGMNL